MNNIDGPQQRATIFIGESDQHGHKPLATEIVRRAHTAGLAGATVLRGIEGFGASNHIHTTRILSLSDDLPLVIVLVDSEARLTPFLQEIHDLITEGLVIIDEVRVIKYIGRPPADR